MAQQPQAQASPAEAWAHQAQQVMQAQYAMQMLQAQQVAQRMYGALPAAAQQAAAMNSAFQAYAHGAQQSALLNEGAAPAPAARGAGGKAAPPAKGGRGSKKRARSAPSVAQQAADESKSLRRKQANRESARRSKLRKKEEYENLAQEAARLAEEGISLRTELARMQGVQDTLKKQNQELQQEVLKAFGTLDGVPGLAKLSKEKAEELMPDSAQPGLGTVSGSLSDASAGRNDVTSAQPPGVPVEGKGQKKGKSAGAPQKKK